MNPVLIAFLLTTFAGLSTGIGSAGFYGPLIGSLLVGIFFILYVVLGNIMKPAETAK
ncbi:unnamed protein product [marine sediment metagenome]|uniref:Uncharacterized protein n=1 Tax=marine sediment metagenome TaxID=412755 RepID=X1LW01_9ZZZZ